MFPTFTVPVLGACAVDLRCMCSSHKKKPSIKSANILTLSPHNNDTRVRCMNGHARNSDRVIAFRVRIWMSCFCTFWTGHFTRPIFLTYLMYLPLTCQLANDSDVQAGVFHKTSDEESESVKSPLSTELRSGADSSTQKTIEKKCQLVAR